MVMSSDLIKGSDEKAKHFEVIEGLPVKRYKSRKIGGESFMQWDYISALNDAHDYEPDIVIAHNFRHTHAKFALKLKETFGCKAYVVTHAPFKRKRKLLASIAVALQNETTKIAQFDRIIPICKWEMSDLKKLGGGIPNQKIKRIPNAIGARYFTNDTKPGDGILFLGRLHPVKDIRTLTNGLNASKRYNKATIVGDGDDSYKADMDFWERAQRIVLLKKGPVYDVEKKIQIIDDHEIFVLPSLMEAMPISLIEAMARGKIVVATRTEGAKELIKDEVNGFLVDIGDSEEMGDIFDRIYEMPEEKKQKIREAARESAKEYKMEKIMERWESVFNK